MNLTEIRTKLVLDPKDKLRAFATITLDDCLVIRDLKVIDGTRGLFVAMPSRKLQDRCPWCSAKNHVRARFCNDCGKRQQGNRARHDPSGRMRLYSDIAHPIHQGGRDEVQRQVLEAFQQEQEASRQEGYVGHTFDDLDYDDLARSSGAS